MYARLSFLKALYHVNFHTINDLIPENYKMSDEETKVGYRT